MTEELKQEAEKWLIKFLLCNDCKRKCHCIELNAYCEEQVLKAYIDSAEPREKRIAELTDNIREVTRELEEERFVTEDLKKQIEKMKCCGNCKHFKLDNDNLYPINVCELTYPNRCKNYDKWEMTRSKK